MDEVARFSGLAIMNETVIREGDAPRSLAEDWRLLLCFKRHHCTLISREDPCGVKKSSFVELNVLATLLFPLARESVLRIGIWCLSARRLPTSRRSMLWTQLQGVLWRSAFKEACPSPTKPRVYS